MIGDVDQGKRICYGYKNQNYDLNIVFNAGSLFFAGLNGTVSFIDFTFFNYWNL